MRLLITALVASFLYLLTPAAPANAVGCTTPTYPTTTGSYRYLKVKGASCRTGEKVAQKFWECRQDGHPETGYCVHRVAKGWACREERFSLDGSYQANVKCGRKDRDHYVKFGYTQTYPPA